MNSSPRLFRLADADGRRLLATAILGSGMVFLDGTIATVALPRIGAELGGDLAALQWVLNGYTLGLAAFIIVGGSLGDRFGRRRMYGAGVASFAVASVVVALSPTIGSLVAARLLQGVAAALLTPGSLSMLQASFHPEDRMRAIGAWSGTLGITTAAGPIVGGALVGIDWRLGFWINVPIALVVLWLLRAAPESSDPQASRRMDLPGLALAPAALAGITWALTDWPSTSARIAGAAGLIAAAAFVVVELRSRHPMVPPSLFSDRVFTGINVATLVVYGAFAASQFFLTLFLQVAAGWTPLQAGAAGVPVSLFMLVLSARFGAYATRHGPRAPMVVGMLLVAVGFALLSRAPLEPSYPVHLLPGILVQGLGMSMLVAPLTGSVLAAVPEGRAGIASGINNAVSRSGGLISIAALPLLVGLSGTAYRDAIDVAGAYSAAMLWCVALMAAGALVAALTLGPGSGASPTARTGQAGPGG